MNVEKKKMLINNDLNWHVVTYTDGSVELKHHTGLSSILDCGEPMEDFDIAKIEQCWNGEDLEIEE